MANSESSNRMMVNRRLAAALGTCWVLALGGACAPAATQQAIAPPQRSEWAIPPLPPPQAIAAAEYAQRRVALAAQMSEGVLVAFGSPRPLHDYLPYAQDSNFRYLTGGLEPDAALVLIKQEGRVAELLFVAPRDPAAEIWEGERLGLERARALTGVTTRAADRLVPVLDSLLTQHRRLYTLIHLPSDPAALETLSREQQILGRLVARHPGTAVAELSQALLRLRPAVERYRDIGVRIEDVYIVSATDTQRVSAGVPREIEDIEALMREAPLGAERRRPEVVEWYRGTEPRAGP